MAKKKKEEFISVKEAALQLGVSPPTVRMLIKSRILLGIRIGKRTIKVDRQTLEDYLEKQRKETAYAEEIQ